MGRTKGSKNIKKVNKVLKPLSNFKSMEVTTTKTQISQVAFTKNDIENLLKEKARELAGYKMYQFESETIIYDKKGNAFLTLINPNIKEQVAKATISLTSNEKS